MKRHARDDFFVVGEGVFELDNRGEPRRRQPSTAEELRRFRFSRMGPRGAQIDEATRLALATAMTDPDVAQSDSVPAVPAGFTYLGQFVDHDLTMDRTETQLGEDVNLDDLVQARSPALDLDSLYGRGPNDKNDRKFYNPDGVTLKLGRTSATGFPAEDPVAGFDLDDFDLPRVGGTEGTLADRRLPLIPDTRNDENLAVAQTHLAFIRFHNRVVEELSLKNRHPGQRLFEASKKEVVRHYQWMLKTDFLPRIVDPAIVTDVFTNGRRFFEPPSPGRNGHRPTMPLEFAVASYRLGHSMVRTAYEWNRVFNTSGNAGPPGTLEFLFTFTGVAGNFGGGDLDDPNSGTVDRLPTNWIADFRRLYDFTEAGRSDLVPPAATGGGNITKRIDTLLVDPLSNLPLGTFGGRGTGIPPGDRRRNLAFRNLTRANMVNLASGQQMAAVLKVKPLTAEQILNGNDGVRLDSLTEEQRSVVTTTTPLWFYILREAEFNGGLLGAVGGRIVAEVFHRSMEGSRTSIVRDPSWRPTFGPDRDTFRMVDLMLFAFEGKADLLNPLGD